MLRTRRTRTISTTSTDAVPRPSRLDPSLAPPTRRLVSDIVHRLEDATSALDLGAWCAVGREGGERAD